MYDLKTGSENEVDVAGIPTGFHEGTVVLYRDERGGPGEGAQHIVVYDLDSGEEEVIHSRSYGRTGIPDHNYPDVYNDYVAFVDKEETPDDVRFSLVIHNLETGEQQEVGMQGWQKPSPKFYGDIVVYRDYDPEAEKEFIYSYNYKTMEKKDSTDTRAFPLNHDEMLPNNYEDAYVFSKVIKDKMDVYVYNDEVQETRRIITNGANQWSPDVWEDTVVWEDHRSGEAEIYMAAI